MKRTEAEQIAAKMQTLQLAYEDRPERLIGIRLAAIFISDIISGNGVMEEVTYLRACGFDVPKKLPPAPAPAPTYKRAEDNMGPYGYRRRAPRAEKASQV